MVGATAGEITSGVVDGVDPLFRAEPGEGRLYRSFPKGEWGDGTVWCCHGKASEVDGDAWCRETRWLVKDENGGNGSLSPGALVYFETSDCGGHISSGGVSQSLIVSSEGSMAMFEVAYGLSGDRSVSFRYVAEGTRDAVSFLSCREDFSVGLLSATGIDPKAASFQLQTVECSAAGLPSGVTAVVLESAKKQMFLRHLPKSSLR